MHWPVGGSHTPSKHPMVSCEQFLGTPPWHTPATQVLLTVQRAVVSVHGPPSLPTCSWHMPSAGSHTATWQSSCTGKKKQSSMVPPVQRPLLQVEPLRQRLAGS